MPRGRPKNKEAKNPPEIAGATPVTPQENPSEKLMVLMQDFAQALQDLKVEVSGLKVKIEQQEKVGQAVIQPNTMVSQPQSDCTSTFLSQVPSDFLQTANNILGDKFQFQCDSLPDQPSFMFTVIVPPEYSPVKFPEIDRRPKVIQNVMGVNGVRDWCMLVKQNVLKYMGQNLITTKF